MKIMLFGATGFVGRALTQSLERQSHSTLIRDMRRHSGWAHELADCDAVINLAGAPVMGRRWNSEYKTLLIDSRVQTTTQLSNAIAELRRAGQGPRVCINASAIGYYPSSLEKSFRESDPPGNDFLAKLCQGWEKALHAAELETIGVRCAIVRIGIVLGAGGGALAQMLGPFKLGLGGPIAGGHAWMSWIHIDDLVAIFEEILKRDDLRGVFNATAPHPVTNAQFTHALAEALNRPAVAPLPAFALKLRFGEAAEVMLASQRVFPERIVAAGYHFRFEQLDRALADSLKTRP